MSSVTEKMSEYLEFLKTPEGEESIREFKAKLQLEVDIKDNNIERIKKMFNDQETFDSLVNRIICKNGDEWRDKCWKNGCMPYPTNLLNSLFDLAEQEGVEITETIDDFTEHFQSDICEYKGWQFAMTYGQGTCGSIYYNKKLMYRD